MSLQERIKEEHAFQAYDFVISESYLKLLESLKEVLLTPDEDLPNYINELSAITLTKMLGSRLRRFEELAKEIPTLTGHIRRLRRRIERMRSCENCVNFIEYYSYGDVCVECRQFSNWEFQI